MSSREPDNIVITLPVDSNPERTWQQAVQKAEQYAHLFKFEVPTLKVGSLDALVKESEQLRKNESYAEKVTRRISKQLEQILNDKDRCEEALQADGKTPAGFLTSFRWDGAKFNITTSLTEICKDVISKVADIDAEMKKKVSVYNKTQSTLRSMEKASTGTLVVRSLDELVKKEDFINDSEYLQTVCAVVPKKKTENWLAEYEKLNECIVPRSSRKVYEDETHALFTCTMLKKVVKEVTSTALSKGFVIREFEFDDEAMENREKKMKELQSEVQRKHNALVRWCTTMFGEAYIAWIHTKALGLFVESVLRYGLPVNFVSILLRPKPKCYAKLRKVLNDTYAHLDANGSSAGDVELPSLALAGVIGTYYPYVNTDINSRMLT